MIGLSPLEYPKISHDRFIAPLREGVREVQQLGCRYIMQIGDAGGHTQTSLFPKEAGGKSASYVFDLLFGYRNHTVAMTLEEVEQEVELFGAEREFTASLIEWVRFAEFCF